MDFTVVVFEALSGFWWLIPFALILGFFRSPWFKGQLGEFIVRFSAKLFLPREHYHPIHNVTLPTLDGTTQIDHIFVSRFGVFVVETKNMSGWIFGSEKQVQWTQKIYKKSYRFQNPLRQNYKHVKALEAALDTPTEAIHSVVVFVGGSTFKTNMPANVTSGGGYISYIKSFREPVLLATQVRAVIQKIESGRLQPSMATNREHVKRLRSRSDTSSTQLCPKCGSQMILRTAKKGAKAGKQFWGCSNFPKCRQMKSAQ